MKGPMNLHKSVIGAFVFLSTLSAFGQGEVILANRVVSMMVARIYGPELADPTISKTGNTSAGTPAGTQVYTGSPLSGSGWIAQLFGADGLNQPESALLAANPITTFRTGLAAGYMQGVTATLTGVALDAPAATVQMRIWDDSSGLYPDWNSAKSAWQGGHIAAGESSVMNSYSIGGFQNPPPLLYDLRSFNVYFVAIPEPSTFALLALGACALRIVRRRS
jgi:hypothetical protein